MKCSKEIVWMRKNNKNIWEWEWKEVWKRVAETASFLIIWLCERIVLKLYDCETFLFMQHSATCHLSFSIYKKNKAQGEHKHQYKGQILSQLKHE
jgi:hypothetical protein